MLTKKIPTAQRPHKQFPHFKLVYDLPSPLQPITNADDAAYYFRKIWPSTIDVEVSLSVIMLNVYEQVIAHHTVFLGDPSFELTAMAHYRMINWITAHSCANSIFTSHNVPGAFHLSQHHINQKHIKEALQNFTNAMMALNIEYKDHILITPISTLSVKNTLGNFWYDLGEKEVQNG